MQSITLVMPCVDDQGQPGGRRVVVRTLGDLRRAIGGRVYIWPWCAENDPQRCDALPLVHLDAYSTAEAHGFVIAEASADRQIWLDRSLDAPRRMP